MLDYKDDNNINPMSSYIKNSVNKTQKGNKGRVLKESGAKIISGMNDLNDKSKEKKKIVI